ncbi:MAG: cytosine permease [Nocardioidaceae bacterium]|nr:cytosine permease [Nocardioidaceae bacterium]
MIEVRSIDYVPPQERSGRLTDQATIWFGGSAHILSLATGAIGISLGLNLIWTLIALVAGTVVGTVPVAAHATQGPHLGLPQMVQSRPQFGRYGALFIWAMAIAVYWGYVVLGDNLLGATSEQLGWGGAGPWTIVVGVIAIVLAIFGYHWLHVAQRWVTLALVVALAVYLVGLIAGGHIPAGTMSLGSTFSLAPFMVVVSASAAYQLSWAFFVSDYSRYMPADTDKTAIMGFTALGLFFGVLSFEVVGAICTAVLPKDSITAGLAETGDYVFDGFGNILLVIGALGLLGLMAMCIYGGSLTLITALDSLRPVRPTRGIRVVTILVVGVTGALGAVYLPADFLNSSFYTVLAVLAYLMAPWTAVNLVDFFLVRRGQYSIREIFNADGIYGLWNWRGITAYLLGFAAMVPFMNLTFYEGPLAKALDGVDIAFFVGIPVGAVAYALLCRGMDLVRERAAIAEADRDLDLDLVAVPIA